MLIDTDDSVLAAVNVHAVLGALPRLAELAPEAGPILSKVAKPTTLTLRVANGALARYRFTTEGVSEVSAGTGPTLVFRNAAHCNAVIAGTAQPIPIAGPTGLRFLTGVFTPLTDLLSEYAQPRKERLAADPDFATSSALVTLDIAGAAIAVVANGDRSGRVSASHMPDGSIDLEVGDEVRYRFVVRGHRLRLDRHPVGTARATLRFADLTVLSAILSGSESAIACVSDGRLAMRGYIPFVDNTSRILDRVGAYLGA